MGQRNIKIALEVAYPQMVVKPYRSNRIKGTQPFFAFYTDVTEKLFVRVDVTEEFPFLVAKMSPYYDR